MSKAIIGYTGFIGSYLKTIEYKDCDYYNSKNINEIHGKHYEIIYICALPATKWIANNNPLNDLSNMLELQENLNKCKSNIAILISTIDIYSKDKLHQNENDEDITIEPYGKHRYIMERWIMSNKNFIETYVIRLPGIFGFGLKKNIIYDFLNNNNINSINPFNIFQWYWLDDLMNDIKIILENKIKLINLFSEPIRVLDIINNCFPEFNNNQEFNNILTTIKYDYKTIYTSFYRKKEYILNKLKEYIYIYRNVNKLVVSNLIFNENENIALDILKRYGINKLELALTKYCTWDTLNLNDIQKRYEGFEIYSLQALFYGLSYNIFIDTELFIAHFIRIINIAQMLKVKCLVFGSPKNRYVPNGFKDPKTFFINTMKNIMIDINDVIVCIEPNAIEYGCNFINTIEEAVDIIQQIDLPNVKLNLDTGNTMMMNDNLDLAKYIGHIQISAPYLKEINDFIIPTLNWYNNIKSLEMKEVSIEKFEINIKKFILF
jgi:sugar phosphate isomerase/epimerase/nucleoside-diphosphate-sugar epimerase